MFIPHKNPRKTHQHSAKIIYNVISKHYPSEKIEFPTRRNYLEHLLKTKPELSYIEYIEFEEEEMRLKNIYLREKDELKERMLNWISNKTEIEVNFIKYYARMKGEIHFNEYDKKICKIISTDKDEIKIEKKFELFGRIETNNRIFKCDTDSKKWYSGKDYIEYIE
jgi:hypothetical protein